MSALDIFAGHGVDDQFATYRVQLRILDKIVGGVPSSESVIKGWLKSRMDLGDRDLQDMVDKTLAERFPDRQPAPDELANELMKTDAAPSINGFKRIFRTAELAYEGRCMKAALKEWTNSAYPGLDWPGKPAGKTAKDDATTSRNRAERPSDTGRPLPNGFKKGAQSTLEERAFIEEFYIGLGVFDPTDLGTRVLVEERIKHVMTPMGPRSSIARVEVVEQPTLEFTLRVRDDFLPMEAWGRIWQAGEQIGIGADRGRSDGRFELLAFDRA
ncbi:hypothetical protein [Nonomuraea basaltis]|uniref:hypothetical protein n=1 Tax=Nonomuraea basaltis TaxID=2495887 RepID=UPI00110C4AFB|nr:hypothetical protein [Nonomuraea basaltis]TMR91277.1 hypothetical protein EJK15_50695 [Nonomuraea basaltis]